MPDAIPSSPAASQAPENRPGRHPQEQGEPSAPGPVPEVGEIVPNRHSASAEAALLRWREAHER